jgi:hypothetical protein
MVAAALQYISQSGPSRERNMTIALTLLSPEILQVPSVRSLAVLTCECSETCIMAMHVVSQDDLISIAQFDLDQNQNTSSPQTDCNSLLSLCPCIKHQGSLLLVPGAVIPASTGYRLWMPICRMLLFCCWCCCANV